MPIDTFRSPARASAIWAMPAAKLRINRAKLETSHSTGFWTCSCIKSTSLTLALILKETHTADLQAAQHVKVRKPNCHATLRCGEVGSHCGRCNRDAEELSFVGRTPEAPASRWRFSIQAEAGAVKLQKNQGLSIHLEKSHCPCMFFHVIAAAVAGRRSCSWTLSGAKTIVSPSKGRIHVPCVSCGCHIWCR